MGGFHVFRRENEGAGYTGEPCYPLEPYTVTQWVKTGKIDLPCEEDIRDKSKVDWLAKIIVLLQTAWFITQCVVRIAAHLPITELEIITLAYTIMNIGIYLAWWNKPYNVERPIPVYQPDAVPPEKSEKREDFSNTGWIRYMELVAAGFLPGNRGAGEVVVHKLRSVPTFYAGDAGRNDWNISNAITLLTGTLFGAIHYIGWSFTFTSPMEQFLWRLCSTAMVGIPATILVSTGGLILAIKLRSYIRYVGTILVPIMVIFVFLSLSLGGLLYTVARIVTFVLAFKSLTSPPLEAFQTIPWTKLVPHV
jgi:hypothetical protein